MHPNTSFIITSHHENHFIIIEWKFVLSDKQQFLCQNENLLQVEIKLPKNILPNRNHLYFKEVNMIIIKDHVKSQNKSSKK